MLFYLLNSEFENITSTSSVLEDSEATITVDLPGIDPSTIQVLAEDRSLKVLQGKVLVYKRVMPTRYDLSRSTAKLVHGRLTVKVPVSESIKAKPISIKLE